MTDKIQKIRQEVEKLKSNLVYGACASQVAMETRCKEEAYNEVLAMLDSTQEEPVSKLKLSNVQRNVKNWKEPNLSGYVARDEDAEWVLNNLWKPADGDELPKIDREVIVILDNGKVVFAHRPPEYWDGKDIVTGKVTRNYPKTYDKGGWNIPNVKYWLDCSLPNMEVEDKERKEK